jgi:hypothetical protein
VALPVVTVPAIKIDAKAAVPTIRAAILKDEISAIFWFPVLEVLPHHAADDHGTVPE